jgi:Toastrack DUF4097/LiaI-LiaF-like transmembrane region
MRRSISGPLIVIAIGVLFLLNNFYPDVITLHSLFRYWPFLLIGLGVIRLVEVLVDAGRARPLPPARFSAGGVILLVMLCFIFWGISKGTRTQWRGTPFVNMKNSMRIFGESFDFDVKQSLPVTAADTRVILEGLRGNVNVSGDDSNEVAVSGRKTIHAFSQSQAAQGDGRTHLEIIRNGNDLVVRSTGSVDHDHLSISYDVDIKVPRRMSLSAQGSPENVTAESLDGNVDISGGNGNVRLTSIGGNVRVETTRRKDLVRAVGIKGNLDVRGTGTDLQLEDVLGQVTIQGNFFGTLDFRNLAKPLHFESDQTDLRVEKLPGSISMDLGDFRAENVTGPLRLRCQSRDVHITNFSNDVEVNLDRGDIELNPQRTPVGKMDVHLRAGNVDLTMPEKAAFDLRASTGQGEVDNQYGKGIATNSEGRTASMKSEASGGPVITLATDRGNITVKKS